MFIEHSTVYLAVLSTKNVQHKIGRLSGRKVGMLQLDGLCRLQWAKRHEDGPQHFRNKRNDILLL